MYIKLLQNDFNEFKFKILFEKNHQWTSVSDESDARNGINRGSCTVWAFWGSINGQTRNTPSKWFFTYYNIMLIVHYLF